MFIKPWDLRRPEFKKRWTERHGGAIKARRAYESMRNANRARGARAVELYANLFILPAIQRQFPIIDTKIAQGGAVIAQGWNGPRFHYTFHTVILNEDISVNVTVASRSLFSTRRIAYLRTKDRYSPWRRGFAKLFLLRPHEMTGIFDRVKAVIEFEHERRKANAAKKP